MGQSPCCMRQGLCFGALWDPLKAHTQWFSILYAFRDLRRIMFRRIDLRVKYGRLLQKRINHPHPLRGTGPGRTLLMHLNKCEWAKAVASDSLIVAHVDLGTMYFFTSHDAQLKRWLSYTARHVICEGLRARTDGETNLSPRKDAIGIPAGFVLAQEFNRLLFDNKVTEKGERSNPPAQP